MSLALLDTLFALVKLLYFFSAWQVFSLAARLIKEQRYLLPILAVTVLLTMDRFVS